jgi:hypothetical protein
MYDDDVPDSKTLCTAAFVEELPFALTYTANLEPRDRALLFHDNLVVAAEYLCAFIEEGIGRHEVTCTTGLETSRYHALFEQVGIRVTELENCGYLRNLSTNDWHTEIERSHLNDAGRSSDDPLSIELDDDVQGMRLVHIHNPRNSDQKISLQGLMEDERKAHKLSSFPTTSICCYDAKLVLEDAPHDVFKELLKAHDHCIFQGMAMPTERLLSLRTDPVYPKLRST